MKLQRSYKNIFGHHMFVKTNKYLNNIIKIKINIYKQADFKKRHLKTNIMKSQYERPIIY